MRSPIAAFVALLTVLAPSDRVLGQEFAGWHLIAESARYDFLVRRAADTIIAESDLRLLIVSQMLVREAESERKDLGTGYEDYASTTHVIEVHCTERASAVVSTTVFNRSGVIIDRPEAAVNSDSLPMGELIEWGCDGGGP